MRVYLKGLGLIVLLSLANTATAAGGIVIARANAALHGLAAQGILEEAYRRAGIEFSIQELPTKRALIESSSGNLDGEMTRIPAIGDRYPTLKIVHPPIAYLRSGAFFRQGEELDVSRPEDLAPYKVGVLRGVLHANNNARFAGEVIILEEFDQLVRMLDTGRVDAIISSVMPFHVATARLGAQNINPEPVVFQSIPLHHFLHEDHAVLVPVIGGILAEMTASGDLDALFRQGVAGLH